MVHLFGSTIRETLGAFPLLQRAHLGKKKLAEPMPDPTDRIKAIGRIIVSLGLLGLAGYLTTGDDQKQKIAYGLIGTLTGYWLK